MQPYLSNKGKHEFETMSALRDAAHEFESNEAAERFIVEKMRPSLIDSWEYKLLVALVFTNIYPKNDTVDPKVTKTFEKTIFGKGETKDQELGVKILYETWRSEAMALFDAFEKASTITGTAKEPHPLKESLIAEFLVQFCAFTAKCKVLSSKKQLVKLKDPSKFGIDFMQGLTQV